MWYPLRHYSLSEARTFLREDFARSLRRTRHFYVTRRATKRFGRGFFEPLLLGLCWCDFLGALYCGDGRTARQGGIGNEARICGFLDGVVAQFNPRYSAHAKTLVKVYRNGTVHAYAPAGPFEIHDAESERHLSFKARRLVVVIDDFLRDLLAATLLMARTLSADDDDSTRGSLAAFNKARMELG